jgi:hypothetical protein
MDDERAEYACGDEGACRVVIPADHNWVRNVAVPELLVHALESWTRSTRRPISR